MAGIPDSAELIELESRLVYSLLGAAVRLAARFNLPLDRLVELLQLAYFNEQRQRHPRGLAKIAGILGVSLRTVGSLNRRLKGEFFRPENEVRPVRETAGVLVDGPKTLDELCAATDLEERQVVRALVLLAKNGWIEEDDGRYSLRVTLRQHFDQDAARRIDGLNNQMEILAESVWSRFVDNEQSTAGARSWSFVARPEDLALLADRTVRNLRHSIVDLEESALAAGRAAPFGVTIAFAPLKGKKP